MKDANTPAKECVDKGVRSFEDATKGLTKEQVERLNVWLRFIDAREYNHGYQAGQSDLRESFKKLMDIPDLA
jgi:hypothetical protein